jgi:hypothetical protein
MIIYVVPSVSGDRSLLTGVQVFDTGFQQFVHCWYLYNDPALSQVL